MKLRKNHATYLATPSLLVLMAAAFVVDACSKTESGPSGSTSATTTALPPDTPTISITGTPPPAAIPPEAASLAAATASPRASASTSASASASAAPSARTSKGPAASVSAGPPLKPASTRLTGNHFTLDVGSPGCRVDAPCAVTLQLGATGGYHVNKEYPYKFTAVAAPGVQFLGSPDANVFSRASGDFREDGEHSATMTVRFKPTAAGEARVSGAYKMSVCSAENCQIETQTVQLAVPVM